MTSAGKVVQRSALAERPVRRSSKSDVVPLIPLQDDSLAQHHIGR